MRFFTAEYLRFFRELAANNRKEWFYEHKSTFTEQVQLPFENFIGNLIETLSKHEPALQRLKPKDCMFRIYRDVRFSKDKSPYKLQMGAVVSPNGRKSSEAGLYLEAGPEFFSVYMGVYEPAPESLNKIRTGIAKNIKTFDLLLNEKNFKSVFGTIHGEKSKRLDASLGDAAKKCEFIYNKQFYFYHKEDAEIILSDNLIKTVQKYYLAGKNMNDFLASLMK